MHNTTTVPSRHFPSLTFKSLALLGALLLPAMTLAASDDKPADRAPEVREPAEVYRQVCAHCHASEYAVGPETITLAVPEAGREAWREHIRGVVRNGRAAMPAFREAKISDAELDALAEALARGDLAEPAEEE